jgi:signal transduction histidine kinase
MSARTPDPSARHGTWIQVLAVAVVVATSLAASIIYVLDSETELIQSIALDDAKRYTTALAEFRTLYTSEVVERARAHGVEVTHNYLAQPGAIPLPATLTMLLGDRLDEQPGGGARLYSAYPFPWRRDVGGPQDTFEMEALTTLQANPDVPFFSFESDRETPRLRYAVADRMRVSCVDCHNSHPDSPKRDWRTGDVRGVLAVTTPLGHASARARSGLRGILAITLAAFAVGILGLGVLAIRLRAAAANAANAAERTRQMNVALGDEIAQRERVEEDHRAMQAKMLHAQKLESLGLLAGGIAHDFNNFLQGIVGHAQLASLKLKPTDAAQGDMSQVQVLVKQAATLTEQLLAYAGKAPFTEQLVDLSALISEMQPLISTMAGGALDIEYALQDHLPLVEGSPAQLRQVVLNLLTNAADAVQENRGSIRVTTSVTDTAKLSEIFAERAPSSAQCVYLEVRDTGAGMTPETLSKAFDPFFTTKTQGRGLGLAALQGIVRGHNGGLDVHSDPETGTTFRVILPAGEQIHAEASTSESAPPPTAELTVLVVDDYAYVREVAAETLEAMGHRVIQAASGARAAEILRASAPPISAVLLDLLMPEMDGAETFRLLRQIDPHVPVILVSGHTEPASVQDMMAEPKVTFLAKPYSSVDIRRCLDQLFPGP